MVIAKLAGLLLLFPVLVFVPGFLVSRRWRLPEELRLGVAIATSLLLLAAAAFLLYLGGAGRIAYAGVSAAVVAGAVGARHSLGAFVRRAPVRTLLLQYAVFLAWLLVLSCVSRNFSGDGWAGDWEEHYQRALLFGGERPLDAPLVGGWSVAARPPLQNLVAAFLLQSVDSGFTAYQLGAVLLSSLVFFGAAALGYALQAPVVPTAPGHRLPLVALLCLNPCVVQNATYTWTRSLTNFLVLQGLALLWMAVRDDEPSWRRWACLHLGLAAAAHYSAGPYAAALVAFVFLWLVTRRLSLGAAAADMSLLAAPLVPWLAFCAYHFGVATTFLSNSTAMDTSARGLGENLGKMLGNVVSTWIPHVARGVPSLHDQADRLDYVRDSAFLVYQSTLPFMVGSIGGLLALGLAARAVARARRARSLAVTLAVGAFAGTVFLLGIASVGEPERFGAGHICLQPLALAGVVFVAAQWSRLSALLKISLGLGMLADAALGIGLHFWMRHLVLADLEPAGGAARAVSPNFLDQLHRQVDMQYVLLGDLPGIGLGIALLVLGMILLVRGITR
jgi:hypothetical protein